MPYERRKVMTLPILTTDDDVNEIVEYLKTKPTGATLTEAKAVVKKQTLDSRKISAYITWGIISKDGERFKLTPRGWELARKSKSAVQLFREILDSISPYRSALEWIYHQKLEIVTNIDVAAHWHEHHSESLGTDKENTIKDQAVCFFHICESAGLGTLTIGRKGQATRIKFDHDTLKEYIEAGPSSPPWVEPKSVELKPDEEIIEKEAPQEPLSEPPTYEVTTKTSLEKLRVFISHGKNTEIVEQVETLLGLADIESEVAVKEETAAIPVPDKVFNAMKRCGAAIIVVAVEEARKDDKGHYAINENILIEIGAAFVLYDKKVVLLWDKRLPVPSNLQGLYRCEFEGNDLNWNAGMKLMKAIKGFK